MVYNKQYEENCSVTIKINNKFGNLQSEPN
jgi:hypothetical protein